MPVGRSTYNSQIPGRVENSVPIHTDIPPTGGRNSDLPFEAVLLQDLQFPYEYFLLTLLPFGAYCCKHCPSNSSERKKSQGFK
jgi:hypothetical protein